MFSICRKPRKLLKDLHNDESGPGTVEWVMMVIVALIIMAVIYFIAQWVMEGGAKEASVVEGQRTAAEADQTAIKGALGVTD